MEPESKKPYRRRMYQRGLFGTIAANVRREFKREFVETCTANGTTPHAVIKAAAEEYVKMHAGPSA